MVVGSCWIWLEKEPREGPTRDVPCARGYTKGKEINVPPHQRYCVAFSVARNDRTASRCRLMRSLLLLESEAMSSRDTIQKETIQDATTLRKGRQRSSQLSTTFRSLTSIGIDLLLIMRCDAMRAIVTYIPEHCSKESNSRARRRTAFAMVTASRFRLGDYN